jgi:hypothetical protein
MLEEIEERFIQAEYSQGEAGEEKKAVRVCSQVGVICQ